METQNPPTFEKYLNDAFERRCQKNASYSLRAFARDLGVPAANLSRAMNGTRGFSNQSLDQMATRLGLSTQESVLFKSLCQKQFAKSPKDKKSAIAKIKEAFLYQVKLSNQSFSLISDWYHVGILALMDTNFFKSDVSWISKQLGLHEKVTQQALDRLVTAGAVKKENNQYTSTGNVFIDPQGVPSREVQTAHQQILDKAHDAIEMQGLDHREFASVVMCFDQDKMIAAKEKIKKFTEEFEAEFGPNPKAKKQGVYALGVQFFQLNTNKTNQGDL